MASGQSARSGAANVSVAPMIFAAIVAAALLVGSVIGMSAASLLPGGLAAGARPAAAGASEALVAVRAGERASEISSEDASSTGMTGSALAGVRAGERASEVPLEAVLAQIRSEEHQAVVP